MRYGDSTHSTAPQSPLDGRLQRAARTRATIYGWVALHPACSCRDVAVGIGLHQTTVRRRLNEMIDEGLLSWDYLPDRPGTQRLWAEVAR